MISRENFFGKTPVINALVHSLSAKIMVGTSMEFDDAIERTGTGVDLES